MIDRAERRAKRSGHRHAGTSHVLLELADGPEPVSTMLTGLGVDRAALVADLTRPLVPLRDQPPTAGAGWSV